MFYHSTMGAPQIPSGDRSLVLVMGLEVTGTTLGLRTGSFGQRISWARILRMFGSSHLVTMYDALCIIDLVYPLQSLYVTHPPARNVIT